MRSIRDYLLASSAVLLLAGAAQAGPSSANEREQTRQLNLQASQQTASAAQPAMATPNIAPIALNSLSSPPDNIATAKVVDDKGTVVGAVQKVDLDQSGKPTRVEIALLGSDRVVALDSASLSYDQPNNVMTAAMDKSQLGQLPVIPPG